MKNEKMKNRKALKIGSYSIGVSAAVLAVAILINLFVAQLPSTLIKPDFTSNKLLSVGEDTEKIVDGIEDEINLYLIAQSGNEDTTVKNFIDRYAALSSKIKVSTVDPVTHPTFTNEYTDQTVNENSIIVVSDKRSRVVDVNDIYQYEITGYEGTYYPQNEYESLQNYAQQYYGQSLTGTQYFFGENEITGALDYVSSDSIPVMYALAGHGETELSADTSAQYTTSYVNSLVSDENVELKSLSLVAGDTVAVPEDAAAVLMLAPTSDISSEEEKALEDYLTGGGDVILFTGFDSYTAEGMPNLAALCAFMGMEAVENGTSEAFVCEGDTNAYKQAPYFVLPTIEQQGINTLLKSTNVTVYMALSQALTLSNTNESAQPTPLLTTSDSAYLYSDESKAGAKRTLAYQSSLSDADGNAEGTMIWFGTPCFVYDQYLGEGNAQIFAAALQKTCEKTSSVSIIGKENSSATLTLTQASSTFWNVVLWGVIPAAVLIAGFAVWFVRRRK